MRILKSPVNERPRQQPEQPAIQQLGQPKQQQLWWQPNILKFGTAVQDTHVHNKANELILIAATTNAIYKVPLLSMIKGSRKRTKVPPPVPGSQGIFKNLLHSADADCPPDESTDRVFNVDQQYRVVSSQSIRSIQIAGNAMIIFALALHGWTVAVYEMSAWQMVYETFVYCKLSDDEHRTTRPRVVVCHTSESRLECNNEHGTCSGVSHCVLHGGFFRRLFGDDVALLQAAVFVFGLPDGRVYWSSPVSSQNTSPRMLYDVEQAVVAICTICDDSSNKDKSGSRRLWLVGFDGKLAMLSLVDSQDAPISVVHAEYLVPGPVICAMAVDSYLFHSTGRLLYRTCLANSQPTVTDKCTQLAMNSYQFYNAVAIAATTTMLCQNSQDIAQTLLILTSRGCLFLVSIFNSGHAPPNSSSSSSIASGETLRNLMTAIDAAEADRQLAVARSVRQDDLLRQISLAGFLASKHGATMLLCTAQRDAARIVVRLCNRSGVALPKGWLWVAVLLTDRHQENASKAVDVGNLCDSDSVEVYFTAPAAVIMMTFVTVIMFDVGCEEDMPENMRVVVVPLSLLHLDALDSCRVMNTSAHAIGTETEDPIISLAKQRPCWHLLKPQTVEKRDNFKMAVEISKDNAAPDDMLRRLLTNIQLEDGQSPGSVQLSLSDGHHVVFCISSDEHRVELSSASMRVLCDMRESLLHRLQNSSQYGKKKSTTTMELRQLLIETQAGY